MWLDQWMRWQQTNSCHFDGQIKHLKTPRISKKDKGSMTTPPKVKKPKAVKLKSCFEIGTKIEGNRVILSLPIKTISEANCEQAWQVRHKRHKKQKNAVFWALLEIKHLIKMPCTITFVRYAPAFLDEHDNLPMAFKWICDAICAEITGDFTPGRADGSKKIKKKYDQVKSKIYGIKIIIEY